MTSATNIFIFTEELTPFPDHTQLPESNGTFVFTERSGGKNWQEHPQSILLTDSIQPTPQQRHPDGHYCIGQDLGIYWRITDPPERGAEAPDWFYVPNVPPTLEGLTRRSYVLWREHIAPLIALEFVSGDGREERDNTPSSGNLLLTGDERAKQESQRAEQERQRGDRLAAQLRALGIEPEI
jgi:Uma2 family endonuclease